MSTATGHKFKHCCGFPFIETSIAAGNGEIQVTIYPNTWGGDPAEVGWTSTPTPEKCDEEFYQWDCINIICARCGKRAEMVNSDADRPHQIKVLE